MESQEIFLLEGQKFRESQGKILKIFYDRFSKGPFLQAC